MGEGGKGMPTDVAPADYFARPVGDERRTARLVLMQGEVPHRSHRKGLEDRQVLAFASDAVERAMKPLDMVKGDGHDFDLRPLRLFKKEGNGRRRRVGVVGIRCERPHAREIMRENTPFEHSHRRTPR
jgi:hypothetical protein